MPKMNGKELSDKIRRELPGIRVLYMSGYTWDVIQYKGILAQGDELIIKPFNTNLLLRKVRDSIDRV
jgi:two-component system NtrC family sensor kinase